MRTSVSRRTPDSRPACNELPKSELQLDLCAFSENEIPRSVSESPTLGAARSQVAAPLSQGGGKSCTSEGGPRLNLVLSWNIQEIGIRYGRTFKVDSESIPVSRQPGIRSCAFCNCGPRQFFCVFCFDLKPTFRRFYAGLPGGLLWR